MLSKKRKRKFDRGFRKCLQGLAEETGTLLKVFDEDPIGHTHRLQHGPIIMRDGDAPGAWPSRRSDCTGTSVGLSVHHSKLHDGARTKNTSPKHPTDDRVYGSEVNECPQPHGRMVSATTNIATTIVQSYKGTTRTARGGEVNNDKNYAGVDKKPSESKIFSGLNDFNRIEKVKIAEFERLKQVATRDGQSFDPTKGANNECGQAQRRSIDKVECRRDQLLTGRKFFFVPLGPNMGFGRLQLLGDVVLSLGGAVIQDMQSGGADTILVVDEGVEEDRLAEFLNRKEREHQGVQSTDCNVASRFQQLKAPANSTRDVTESSATPFARPKQCLVNLGTDKKSEVPGCSTSIRAPSDRSCAKEARASPIAIAFASESVTPAWIMHCSRHGKLPGKSRFRYPPSCEEILFGSEGEERPCRDSEHHCEPESDSGRICTQNWLLRRMPPEANRGQVAKDSQEREASLEEEMRNKAKSFLRQRYAEGASIASRHDSSASNAQLDGTMNATMTAKSNSLSSSTSWRRMILRSTMSADEEGLVGEASRPTIQLSQTDVSQHNLHYSSLVVTKEVEDFYSRNRWVEVLHSAEGTWTERKRRILCGFACSKTSLTLKNQNAHLTGPLEELMQMYEVEGDRWRHLGYKKAVSLLKNLPFRVEHAVQLEDMRGIGKGMQDKVAEILGTGILSKLEEKRKNTELRALLAFNKIWGVGPATARKLFEEGFRSINDLKNYFLRESMPTSAVRKGQHNNGHSREMRKVVNDSEKRNSKTAHRSIDFASAGEMHNERNGHGQKWAKRRPRSLTPNQRVGLQLYGDLLARIPREEVREIEAVVTKVAKELCSAIEATTCGSYRRGKTTCGDVDILLTRTDQDDCDILNRLIPTLSEIGFLSHHLQLPGRHAKGHSDSYMGVCRLPTPTRNDRAGSSPTLHRRIDIKAYPRSKYPLAILYFTGSDHFNRSMRLYAKKTGWKLTDTALIRQNSVVAEWKGQHVDVESERDIFIAIGLDYKEPWERSCFDLDMFEEEEKAVRKKLRRQEA